MSTTPPALENARLTSSSATPVLKTSHGFADAEGALNNYFVNGKFVYTTHLGDYNAPGTIKVEDFVQGWAKVSAAGTYNLPSLGDLVAYLDRTRIHSANTGAASVPETHNSGRAATFDFSLINNHGGNITLQGDAFTAFQTPVVSNSFTAVTTGIYLFKVLLAEDAQELVIIPIRSNI